MADKKSKIKGIPPRVQSKFNFKGFFDEPTKLRQASDLRYGDLPFAFNESTTFDPTRFDTTPGISGSSIVLPTDGEFTTITRQQDYDSAGLRAMPVLPIFRDSQQYALDFFEQTGSSTYEMLSTGALTTFKQPTWAKSKIEIDLPSRMSHKVTFSISQSIPLWDLPWMPGVSTGASSSMNPAFLDAFVSGSSAAIYNSLTGALGKSYPMLYYNADLQVWEPIGKGWTPCASFIPSAAGEFDPTISPGYVGSHEHATVGFSPSILNYYEGKGKYLTGRQFAKVSMSQAGITGSITEYFNLTTSYLHFRWRTAMTASREVFAATTWEEQMGAGQPIDDFGFPFAAKYHATSSQTIKMNKYIKKPFAVERIAVDFDNVEYTLFDTAYNMLSGSATTDENYLNFITSSIAPGVINNFFVLNQRRNQQLDSKLLLASFYSSLYEGINKGIYKSLDGWLRSFWNITGPFFTVGLGQLFEYDFDRAYAEMTDTFAPVMQTVIAYYFPKLPLQLTLPQTTPLTYQGLVTGTSSYVDTIREIVTWGGISSFTPEATRSYARPIATLSESITANTFVTDSLGAPSINTFRDSIGMSHAWARTIPVYKFLLEMVKKKKTNQPTVFSLEEMIVNLTEYVPGLTSNQAKFLTQLFDITRSSIDSITSGGIVANWAKPGWEAEYTKLFANTVWDVPLTQSASPYEAMSREANIVGTQSLATTRLPAMSFSRSVKMMLPNKSPSATNFIDYNTFLWQPNNFADIHPVFCTSTHGSFELGGRNGLGALHLTDREPESGFRNANVVLNQNLAFQGTMFGNLCDGEIEEHAMYSYGYLAPRKFLPTASIGYQNTTLILAYLGYASPTVTLNHGQYYVQARKLYDMVTGAFDSYKESFYSDTPYILFPDDELIFGWQQPMPRDVTFCNWVSQSYYPSLTGSATPSPGIVDISCLRLGNAKIVFYGSEISLGKEKHDTLNQYLTANNVSETIGPV